MLLIYAIVETLCNNVVFIKQFFFLSPDKVRILLSKDSVSEALNQREASIDFFVFKYLEMRKLYASKYQKTVVHFKNCYFLY